MSGLDKWFKENWVDIGAPKKGGGYEKCGRAKADGSGRAIYSPAQFIEYDRLRGVERSGLASIIPAIWPGLATASKGTTGYYWGDLLFSQPLENQNGV